MSEAIDQGLFHRMRHTPMRDVIRGRLTGRLDINARLAASDLPLPVQELIRRVVRQTRLWKIERVEIADELIAHFADGIEAGASADELIRAFGDEAQAAKLIRRAAIRKRSLAWHALRGLGLMLLILLAFYALLMLRFYLGRPTPSVNYVAMLNEPVLSTPQEDRAWPLYRQILLEIPQRSDRALFDIEPASRRWPELSAWLEVNQPLIERIRHASQKPALGFVLGRGGDAYDPQLYPDRVYPPVEADDAHNEMLVSVLLPHVMDLRLLALVLRSDAHLARQQQDGERLERNIVAIARIADQLRSESLILIPDLVARGIRLVALDQIERTLLDAPELLDDQQLQRLAHRFAKPSTNQELISLRSERMMFHDIVQRVYTDDGGGDGRLTRQAYRILSVELMDGGMPPIAQLTMPVLTPSRKEILSRYDALMDQSEALLAQPRREADWRPLIQQVEQWRESNVSLVRYRVLNMFVPTLNHLHDTTERYLARRDAILTAMALELYRRGEGAYPPSLKELTPVLLPSVPVDRITGEPLRYRIVDGRPLLYSVGANRVDDGGTPALDHAGQPYPAVASRWDVAPEQAPAGDWVLYPEPRVETWDDDELE